MKVLIVRFSSIGDIVLTSPVIRCLRQQTGAEVHYLTKEVYKTILEANPYLEKVYSIRKNTGEILNVLRQEQYDAVIDLHNNLRSWQLHLGLRGAAFHQFDKQNLRKWLMVRTKSTARPVAPVVQRYLKAAAPLGVQDDRKGLDFFIPANQELSPENLAGLFSYEGEIRDLVRQGKFYAFAIGAAHATKCMPWQKIASICQSLNFPVLLLGGARDAVAAKQIVSVCGSKVAEACGKFSLHESASALRQSLRVITHDTGLMHIAAALHKEIISVWGNTVPEFGMAPWYPTDKQIYQHVAQVKDLSCRPCSKIGFDQCPRGHFRCMNDLNTEEIALAAMRAGNIQTGK